MNRIIICGPESTGKTMLTQQLAAYYKTIWVPEYAREYIGGLNRSYDYSDIVKIAEQQKEELQHLPGKENKFIFFDTSLIVTKIWMLEAYGKYPDWIDDEIIKHKPGLYLLCYHDLPWQFDKLRENGSDERRAYLFKMYYEEIKKINCDYQIIKGFNYERYKLAIKIIEKRFS